MVKAAFYKIRLRQPDGVWRQGHDLVLMHMDKVKLVDIARIQSTVPTILIGIVPIPSAIIKFSR